MSGAKTCCRHGPASGRLRATPTPATPQASAATTSSPPMPAASSLCRAASGRRTGRWRRRRWTRRSPEAPSRARAPPPPRRCRSWALPAGAAPTTPRLRRTMWCPTARAPSTRGWQSTCRMRTATAAFASPRSPRSASWASGSCAATPSSRRRSFTASRRSTPPLRSTFSRTGPASPSWTLPRAGRQSRASWSSWARSSAGACGASGARPRGWRNCSRRLKARASRRRETRPGARVRMADAKLAGRD
mmetsp:Transcript_33163/g.84713  ORF Transcript_33163/g.84713 Transcript_33163/m.84713 type:complete len:247 (-) Transcript_33163:65-805(-)